MFERSLIASQVQYASMEQKWTAITSIALQVAAAGLVVALPLFHQEVLQLKSDPPRAYLYLKPPVIKVVPVQARAASAAPVSLPMAAQSARFEAPRSIPTQISTAPDDGPPRDFSKIGNGMVGDGPGGVPFVGAAGPAVVTVASPHPDKPMRVSAGVTVGLLMAPIRPAYPQIARAAHVEGAVVVEAIISKAGRIESLNVVSGPEMLRRAAIEAIQAARYQPYRLNGEPTEVQTTITVNFKIGA
jgi:periplasmic protein TonB